MGKAAYKALIRTVSSAAVAVIGEEFDSTANITVNAVEYFGFRVGAPLRRVMDSSAGINLYDGVTELDAADIFRVDWLSGTVYLVAEPGGDLTGDFSYFTSTEIVGANNYALDIGGDVLTDTSFKAARENGGCQTRILGLHDVSFSIERFSDFGQQFLDHKRNRERLLIDVTPGSEDCGPYGGTYRGWFVVETDGYAGDVGDLESEAISFNLSGSFEDSFVFIPWEA